MVDGFGAFGKLLFLIPNTLYESGSTSYARFADDLVILVDAYALHDWLLEATGRRLREELAKLQIDIN
jgi:hypothetical protein